MTTIVLDPGHGGVDPGAVAGSKKEAEYNLRIGKLVRDKLVSAGVKVFMTREKDELAGGFTDKSKSLNYRVKYAKEKNADMFVSIHLNAFNTKATGAEVLVNNADATTLGLATSIGNGLAAIVGTHGALLKQRPDLRVLKPDNVRGMLVEVGFIDSPIDMAKIDANISAVVDAIAKPLIAFAGGTVKNEEGKTLPDYKGHQFETAIDYVMKQGIMGGTGDGNFSPNEPITRGQLAAILQRLENRYVPQKK